MRLEVLGEAEAELTEGVGHYEEIQPGLGLRFRDEAHQALVWIRANPSVPRLRPKGYRRVNLRVFPYYIAYFVWADAIWVLAIAHVSRRPEYWIERRKTVG